MNNFRHGLAGLTMVHVLLDWECEEDFAALEAALFAEHQPETPTEKLLVGKMAQHYWLSQRAITIQSMAFAGNGPFAPGTETRIDTYVRYQMQHDRAFQRALHDLLKLRAERRKAEIGFVSQKRHEEVHTHRVERHQLQMAVGQARLEHRQIRNLAASADLLRRPERQPRDREGSMAA